MSLDNYDWPALCRSAYERPLDDWLNDIRSSLGTLSGLLLLVAVISFHLSLRFYRIPKLKRVDDHGRAIVWPLYVMRVALRWRVCALARCNPLCMYGPFISLCACSSVLGSVAFLCQMYGNIAVARAGEPTVASSSNPTTVNRTIAVLVEAQAFPLLAAFDVLYPLEFFLVTNVKLLFIHRFYVIAFKTTTGLNLILRHLFFSSAAFKFLVVLINGANIAGIVLRFIAAHYMVQASSIASSIFSKLSSSSRDPSIFRMIASLLDTVDSSKEFASYQLVLEAAVLMTMALVRCTIPTLNFMFVPSHICCQALVISTFAFWWHARRFSSRAALQSTEKPDNNSSALRAAAAVSRTAVYCALFVVFSVIFRTIFAFPFAVASYADRGDAKCPIMCSSCQKTWFLVYQWLANLSWMRATFLIVR